jgi:hypothetical protein
MLSQFGEAGGGCFGGSVDFAVSAIGECKQGAAEALP